MPWSNWSVIVQTGGIVGALLLVSIALFLDARARRIGNLIQLTQQHRELWERIYTRPRLARILDPDADTVKLPITADEELFVIFLILHLSNTYYAMRAGFYPKPHGLRKDVKLFFSLPIPRGVWEKVKELQDEPFVRFVESCWPQPASEQERC